MTPSGPERSRPPPSPSLPWGSVRALLLVSVVSGAGFWWMRGRHLSAAEWTRAGELYVQGIRAPLLLALGCGAVAGLVSWALLWWRRERIQRRGLALLREPTPAPLIALYQGAEVGDRLAAGDDANARALRVALHAARTTTHALGLLLYGELQGARRALDSVEWRDVAAPQQAARARLEALFALLTDEPPASALAHMREAHAAVARIPWALRWIQREPQAIYSTLVEAAAGEDILGAQRRLQTLHRKTPDTLLHLLALWGLTLAAERLGQRDEASRLRAELRATAPHCRALHASGHASAA